MSWIKVVGYEAAGAKLKKIYDRVKGPDNTIDNVLKIHSLRPHTLLGHMTLYKNVLHNESNQLPKWYLEALGIYVSSLNQCDYCVQHHYVGLKKLIQNDPKAAMFMTSIKRDSLSDFFDVKFLGGMNYARKLTLDLNKIVESDIESLRSLGFTDGEVLEINQVTSYFNYVNRTVVGLGVDTKGDILGLSPKNGTDMSNWTHG